MKRSGFKRKEYNPMKRSSFQYKITVPMKRTKLRVVGDNDTSLKKQDIQSTVRLICCIRDGGCILRDLRQCGGKAVVVDGEIISNSVIQAEHLITRANSATFADTRLIVCICRNCHGWKEFHKAEYDEIIKSILPKYRVELWERCEEDMHRHKVHKVDWSMELLGLKQELRTLEASIQPKTLLL